VVCHELPSPKLVDAPAYASLGEEPTNAGRPAPEATRLTSRSERTAMRQHCESERRWRLVPELIPMGISSPTTVG
jgi:hypothetical protein